MVIIKMNDNSYNKYFFIMVIRNMDDNSYNKYFLIMVYNDCLVFNNNGCLYWY